VRWLLWVAALLLAAHAARADDLKSRLVRIRAYDAQNKLHGCGAGYVSQSGATAGAQIVTAYHVLVPPKSTWCGVPTVGDPNITKYKITRDDGQSVEVSCGEMELIANAKHEDVGFLRIKQSKAATLQVSHERVDGSAHFQEYKSQNSGTIVGYLDNECNSDERIPYIEQSVTLSQPRTTDNREDTGEYIIIPRPEQSGTSGSPVVWAGTDIVIGVYIAQEKVDEQAKGPQGLISPFDTPNVRLGYYVLTGEQLAPQTISPKALLVGVGVIANKALGREWSGLGGQAFVASELLAYRSTSLGFAGSIGGSHNELSWEYRDPLGRPIEPQFQPAETSDVILSGALEMRLVRHSWIHPLLGIGFRAHYFLDLKPPAGLDAVHWTIGGLGRLGLEVPIKKPLVLRLAADLSWGLHPNTSVRYIGQGAAVRYVDDHETVLAGSVQGTSELALAF
jgi:hypothetical protein